MNSNTRTHLNVLFAAGSLLLAAAPAVHAQDAMYSDRTETRQVEGGYVKPNRRRIGTPRARIHPSLMPYERNLNNLGFTLTRPSDVWTASPTVTESFLNAQIAANLLAGLYDIEATDRTVYDTFSKSFEAGDVNSLWAKASFTVTHSGNRNMARLQGEGRIEGALFGHVKTIGLASADLFAPSAGNEYANFSLSVMGQTIWSKNASGATVSLTDGRDWTARLWQTGFDFSIAGYGIGAEVWLEGTVGAHYNATCKPYVASMGADVSADIAFGGHAWANVGIVYADLDAHLDVVKLTVGTGASTNVNLGRRGLLPPRMVASRHTQVDVNFLSGYAKVKVKEPFFDSTLGSWTLWNNPNGIFHLTGVLDSYTKTTTIP